MDDEGPDEIIGPETEFSSELILSEKEKIRPEKFSTLHDLLIGNHLYGAIFNILFTKAAEIQSHLLSVKALRIYINELIERENAKPSLFKKYLNKSFQIPSVQSIRYYLLEEEKFFNFFQKTGEGKGNVKFKVKIYLVPTLILSYARDKFERLKGTAALRPPRYPGRRSYPIEYYIGKDAIFNYLKSSRLVDFGEIESHMLQESIFLPSVQAINKNPSFKQILKLSKALIDLSLAYIPFDELFIPDPFSIVFRASDTQLIEQLIAHQFLNLRPETQGIKDLIESKGYHKLPKADLQRFMNDNQFPFQKPSSSFSQFF